MPTVFSHSIARQPAARRPLKRVCPFVTIHKTETKPAATDATVKHASTTDYSYADVRDVTTAEQEKSYKSLRADHTYTSSYVPTASHPSSATETLSRVTLSETSNNVRTKVSSTTTYLLTKLRQQVRNLQRENAQLKAKMNKMSKVLGAPP